jgi:hypothetical protein
VRYSNQNAWWIELALWFPVVTSFIVVAALTISLKRSIQNLQLSTTTPADYPIFW